MNLSREYFLKRYPHSLKSATKHSAPGIALLATIYILQLSSAILSGCNLKIWFFKFAFNNTLLAILLALTFILFISAFVKFRRSVDIISYFTTISIGVFILVITNMTPGQRYCDSWPVQTRIRMGTIAISLNLFKVHNQKYPSIEYGLQSLLENNENMSNWRGPDRKSTRLNSSHSSVSRMPSSA